MFKKILKEIRTTNLFFNFIAYIAYVWAIWSGKTFNLACKASNLVYSACLFHVMQLLMIDLDLGFFGSCQVFWVRQSWFIIKIFQNYKEFQNVLPGDASDSNGPTSVTCVGDLRDDGERQLIRCHIWRRSDQFENLMTM